MKKIIIILSLVSVQLLNSQSNTVKLNSIMKSIDGVEQLLTLESGFEFLVEIDRKIDFDYTHHRFIVTPLSGQILKLNIISKNDTIEMGWISDYNLKIEKHFNITAINKSSVFMKNYVKNHNKFYNTKLNEIRFRKQIMTEYKIELDCDNNSNESKKSIKYTKKNKTKALNEYLTSFSPELQTLGAIGLLKINNLTYLQEQIIEHFKTRNSVISNCLNRTNSTFNDHIKIYQKKIKL